MRGDFLYSLLMVGTGGLLGSVARYGCSLLTQRWSIVVPAGTLISNLAGCFIIGIVARLAADTEILSPSARLFLATGFCGGFTTMSAFVYELAQFLRAGEQGLAALYFGGTLAGSLAMFWLGSWLPRLVK